MTLCSNVERSVSAGRLADDELSVRVERVVAPAARPNRSVRKRFIRADAHEWHVMSPTCFSIKREKGFVASLPYDRELLPSALQCLCSHTSSWLVGCEWWWTLCGIGDNVFIFSIVHFAKGVKTLRLLCAKSTLAFTEIYDESIHSSIL